LAVDDYEANLFVLAALLEPQGLSVVTTNNGLRAVSLCDEQEFALILLDVRMPGLDGRQAAKLIRRSSLNQHTPVVFVSGDEVIVEELAAQGYDVLAKPYSAASLVNMVESMLERQELAAKLHCAG
jgi:two-component system sensor histidine kinase BarA